MPASDDLLHLVEAEFRNRVPGIPLQVVNAEDSESFGNAYVVLQSGDLRVRVVRERGQVSVDFGSAAEPATWFDSAFVLEHMGLSRDQGLTGGDAVAALHGLADFLDRFSAELTDQFSSGKFTQTKTSLRGVQEASARRRFGP